MEEGEVSGILDYARRKVSFWQTSPISGQFCADKYPYVRKPLLTVDDIRTRSNVLYGPTQSLKTVVLQIVIAYVLDIWRASTLAVAQSDDDSKSFSLVKLQPFLERITALNDTVKTGRSSKTINLWLWANHELIISGPGENAQESKSVRVLATDEAHRYCVSNPGALTALRNRMGDRWDRMEYHATTAADVGTEIDIAHAAGHQDEWHQGCPFCHELIWPLWTEESRAHYNGHEVFRWVESASETETLDSIRMYCPHCDKEIDDTAHNRIDLDTSGDYVSMNPTADISARSFRWNVFAPRWKSWRDILAVYLSAIRSVKLGDLKPYEDWVKKKLVLSFDGQYPLLGDSSRSRNYSAADVIVDPNKKRVMTIDQQEGEHGSGFHLWCLVEEWELDGKSKRINYVRKDTWDDVKAFQLEMQVEDKAVCVDSGEGIREREIFSVCERFHWLAVKSTDEVEFSHVYTDARTHQQIALKFPYSVDNLEVCIIGKKNPAGKKRILPRSSRGQVPPGFCRAKLWSKPRFYPILYALKEGSSREYGIPRDINPVYVDQLHSYIPAQDVDPKTRLVKKIIWRKIKKHDHAFVCSAMGLLMAVILGYFPMDKIEEKKAA